jgi:hypothetical protein
VVAGNVVPLDAVLVDVVQNAWKINHHCLEFVIDSDMETSKLKTLDTRRWIFSYLFIDESHETQEKKRRETKLDWIKTTSLTTISISWQKNIYG